MQQKPPPIQWLPVFEAAARHLNFKHAAAELCVSPPAVSQQIKVLETYLGVKLFDRSTKKLRLTEAGEFYYQRTHDIIKQHVVSYRTFERKYRHPSLQLSAPIYIAQELLIPSYTQFNDHAPGVELRISTGNEYIDFDTELMDAAIRFGPGDWPELDCRFLCQVEPMLVCSPNYLKQHRLSEDIQLSIEELENHVLLSIFDDMRDWKNILHNIEPDKKIICDSYLAAVRSAEEGLGIAVGLKPVIDRLLTEERLTALNSVTMSTQHAYWLVTPHERANKDHIDALHEWLKSLFENL